MSWSEEVVARARGLVGTRFRPQGRKPGVGLDCVGTAAVALGIPLPDVRSDYAMRGQRLSRVVDELRALGLLPVPGDRARPGDLLLLGAGPGQLHFAVLTDRGYVHADAGLGMVVERPGPPPWPMLGTWQVSSRDRVAHLLDEEPAAWQP